MVAGGASVEQTPGANGQPDRFRPHAEEAGGDRFKEGERRRVLPCRICSSRREAGGGIPGGASFGVLTGIFAICIFVIQNSVNLNIAVTLARDQGLACFIQWVVGGAEIEVNYKPAGDHKRGRPRRRHQPWEQEMRVGDALSGSPELPG